MTDFLWGTATAAHQVEGGNVNNDVWLFEHAEGTMYAEPSGDACDHWNRYRDDIKLLASLGLNAYRFSVEWSRIEPAEGEFSAAAIEHYRDMLRACHESCLTPVVTYLHFTSPVWLLRLGGWENPATVDYFTRFCRKVTEELGDLFDYACTMNEPNLSTLLNAQGLCEATPEERIGVPMWEGAGKLLGLPADKVAGFQLSASTQAREIKTAAHHAARDAIKAVKPSMQVGWTLANTAFDAVPGGEERAEALHEANNLWFLRQSTGDDFVGIQTYNRTLIGPDGMAPVPEGATVTSTGEEIWPWAIGRTVREAWDVAKVPVMVTENGLNTTDDAQRVDFLRTAIGEVMAARDDGVSMLGYMCWSAMDNFEWIFGYGPQFGLLAVDRRTLDRTVRPSAIVLSKAALSDGRDLA